LGDRKGIRPVKKWCWFVGGDDFSGALHDLQLQLSSPLPSSLASLKPANPGSPGKIAVKTEIERVPVVHNGLYGNFERLLKQWVILIKSSDLVLKAKLLKSYIFANVLMFCRTV